MAKHGYYQLHKSQIKIHNPNMSKQISIFPLWADYVSGTKLSPHNCCFGWYSGYGDVGKSFTLCYLNTKMRCVPVTVAKVVHVYIFCVNKDSALPSLHPLSFAGCTPHGKTAPRFCVQSTQAPSICSPLDIIFLINFLC